MRYLRGQLFTLLFLFAFATESLASALPTKEPPILKRGMNLPYWMDAARINSDGVPANLTDQYPRKITDADAALLKRLGFDFVRLPIDFRPLNNSLISKQWTSDIIAAVSMLQHHGLVVVVDFHPADPNIVKTTVADPGRLRQYGQALTALASELKRIDNQNILIEIMNEPPVDCFAHTNLWPAMQKSLLAAVRRGAPLLTVVLTGGCGSNWETLKTFNPAGITDPNIYYTFHFYDPTLFTLQATHSSKAAWSFSSGIPYPSDERPLPEVLAESYESLNARGDVPQNDKTRLYASLVAPAITKYAVMGYHQEDIAKSFVEIAAWANRYNVPKSRILLGEFGVFGITPDGGAHSDDRNRWIRDVRSSAEAQGFAWALWAYTSPFGIFTNEKSRQLDDQTIRALGLNIK